MSPVRTPDRKAELAGAIAHAAREVLPHVGAHRAAALLGKSTRELVALHEIGYRCAGAPPRYVRHPNEQFPGQVGFLASHLLPLNAEVTLLYAHRPAAPDFEWFMALPEAAGAEILAGGAATLNAADLQDAWELGIELLARNKA